jgi:peptidyl-prolyl cis-trans isomerase SurA
VSRSFPRAHSSSRRLASLILVALELASALAVAALPRSAHATIVERVVAVVGDKAILLSDLQARAKPFQLQVHRSVPEGASRNAALSQLYRQLIVKLVDEELQGREAARSNITVTSEEIEKALEFSAKQNEVTVQQLFDEAQRNGLEPAEYRQEMRRQLLDAKMLNLRVQGRMRISEDDMKSAYRRASQEERKRLSFRAAWIRFQISAGGGAAEAERVQAKATEVAARARSGADFAALAKAFSSDATTREQGGLLATMQPGELPPEIDSALLALEPGEVAGPVRFGDAWVVLKLVERGPSQIPEYEQAKSQLQNRVYAEKMETAKRQWLDSLRKRTHVDIRL